MKNKCKCGNLKSEFAKRCQKCFVGVGRRSLSRIKTAKDGKIIPFVMGGCSLV